MKHDLPLVLLLASVLYLPAIGARDLWNPNEPVYATAVTEMAARGDWIVPSVNGQPFLEKPILYFWLALLAAKLVGVSELSLRLPAALSGVALVAGTVLLVRPYAGRGRARLAAAIVATFFVVFWSARQIQMDLTLAACSLAALLAASRVLDFGLPRLWGWSLAGIAVGCGLLTKGPVGAICPGLVVLGYVAASGRVRELLSPALAAGAACAAAVAAPWYLALLARGGPQALSDLLVRQNFERFWRPWDHAAGFGYYAAYLWIDLLPWSPLLALAIGLPPEHEGERKLHRLAWIWLVAIVIFFSFSGSKRSPYILPVAPAVAVLVAAVGERWFRGKLDRMRARGCVIVLAAIATSWAAASWLALREAGKLAERLPALAQKGRLMGVVLLLSGAALIGATLSARRRTAGYVALAAVVGIYLFAAVALLPAADVLKSHRPMAETIQRLVPRESPLAGFHVWRWRADCSYYARRTIPVISEIDRLADYWNRDERVFLIVERGRLDEARAVIGLRAPLAYHEAGHNAAYLFSNRASGQSE